MCQNAPFLHPPHAADYIYILDVVLQGVLLYLPDKIEQNMALRISTVLRSMFPA